MSAFIDWRVLVDDLSILVKNPAMRSRERVLLAGVLLKNQGRPITWEAIRDLTEASRSVVLGQLKKLVELGAMARISGGYEVTGSGGSAYSTGWLKEGESAPNQEPDPVPSLGTQSRVPGLGTLSPETRDSESTFSSPETRDSDLYIRDLLTNKPDHLHGESRGSANVLAGPAGLAGSGSDLGSPSPVTPAQGIPSEGNDGGQPAEGHAPDEGPLPGWPDFSALPEPEWPVEWFESLLDLLRDMTPPPQGQRYARPLNRRDQLAVAQYVRDFGGWRRFDKAIIPALREAQGVKSPMGWLKWKCSKASNGLAAPDADHRWVPQAYRSKRMGFSRLVAALNAVAWGGKQDSETIAGAMAWALEHINRAEVREVLVNDHGPSRWATTEVREALARFK